MTTAEVRQGVRQRSRWHLDLRTWTVAVSQRCTDTPRVRGPWARGPEGPQATCLLCQGRQLVPTRTGVAHECVLGADRRVAYARQLPRGDLPVRGRGSGICPVGAQHAAL